MTFRPGKRQRVELRRLNPAEPALQQFKALKQITSLTNQECRAVVSLLHPEGKGHRTGVGRSTSVRKSTGMPAGVWHRWYLDTIHVLATVAASKMWTVALGIGSCCVPVRHATEISCGWLPIPMRRMGANVLAAPAARKVALLYLAWLDFPTLHMEAMWLTASLIKSADANSCTGGYARILKEILERYKEEACNGMAIQNGWCLRAHLCKRMWYFWAITKVSAAPLDARVQRVWKPCIKCSNVLSNGKAEGVSGHVDICATDVSKFQEIILSGVREIANMLESEHGPIQKRRLADSSWVEAFHSKTFCIPFRYSDRLVCQYE